MDNEQVANRMLLNDKDRSILSQYAKRHEKDGNIPFHVVEDYLCTGHGKNAQPVFKWPFLTRELDNMIIAAHRQSNEDDVLTTEEFMTLFETMKIFDNIDSRHIGQIAFDAYAEFIFSGTLFKWAFETEVYEEFMSTLSSSDDTGEGRIDFTMFVNMLVILRQMQAADPEWTSTYDGDGMKGLVQVLDLNSSQFDGVISLVSAQPDDAVNINVWDLLRNLHANVEDAKEATTEEGSKADAAAESDADKAPAETAESEEAKADEKTDDAAGEASPTGESDSALVTELRALYVAALEDKRRRAEEREIKKQKNNAATKLQAIARGRAARTTKTDGEAAAAEPEGEAKAEPEAEAAAAEGEGEAAASEGEGEAKAEPEAEAAEGEAEAKAAEPEAEAKAAEPEAEAKAEPEAAAAAAEPEAAPKEEAEAAADADASKEEGATETPADAAPAEAPAEEKSE